jgi:bla regulator protein blaR1
MVAELLSSGAGTLETLGLAVLAWVLTYAIHSTLALGGAWLVTRRLSSAATRARERLWKFALVVGLATSSAQMALGRVPPLPLWGPIALRSIRPEPSEPVSAGKTAMLGLASAVNASVPRALELTAPPATAPVESKAAFPPLALQAQSLSTFWPLLCPPSLLLKNAGSADAHLRTTPPAASSKGLRAFEASIVAPLAWTTYAVLVWVAGGITGLALFALLWLRFAGRLGPRERLTRGPLVEMLEDLRYRAGVRRQVRLSVSSGLSAPISLGWWRAEICVPPRALAELTDEEQQALLAHELAHLVRRDPLWLSFAQLAQGVFFFQPLHRLARRELEDCSEFLCDAWAVRHTGLRLSLASCLTRVAEWIVGERKLLPAPAMAHGRSRLGQRIERLLEEDTDRAAEPRMAWLAPVGAGLCSVLVLVAPGVAAVEFEEGCDESACEVTQPCSSPLACSEVRDCAPSSDEDRACCQDPNHDSNQDSDIGDRDTELADDCGELGDVDCPKDSLPENEDPPSAGEASQSDLFVKSPAQAWVLSNGKLHRAAAARALRPKDLALLDAELERQVDALEGELSALRERAEELGLNERFEKTLAQMETSMRTVREKRARLARLIETLENKLPENGAEVGADSVGARNQEVRR